MSSIIATAREAEALEILLMLDEAIADGMSMEDFRASLRAYIKAK
jgi:hypothetical protein